MSKRLQFKIPEIDERKWPYSAFYTGIILNGQYNEGILHWTEANLGLSEKKGVDLAYIHDMDRMHIFHVT